jgi:hypothetical protein
MVINRQSLQLYRNYSNAEDYCRSLANLGELTATPAMPTNW